MFRGIFLVMLLSYSISSGALESPDVLLSYSKTTMASHISINHTNNNPNLNPLNVSNNELIQVRGRVRGQRYSAGI